MNLFVSVVCFRDAFFSLEAWEAGRGQLRDGCERRLVKTGRRVTFSQTEMWGLVGNQDVLSCLGHATAE